MRLVHTIPSVAKEASGPSYSVVRLCESLIAQGQDITLAALQGDPVAPQPLFLKTFPPGWGPGRLGRSPAMKQWLSGQAESGSVDLIHNHSLWMMPNVYSGQVSSRYGVPLVVSPRGTLSEWAMQSGSAIKRVFWPLLQRPALSAAACFHATAESEYMDIRRMGFSQPVAVIPNGIDIPALPPRAGGNPRTLLFLGRIHPVKGLDMLLPAWKAVQETFPDWRLHIVGPDSGGYLAQVRRMAVDMGLERIEFCGALYGTEKWQAYRDADLFVLPSHSENFGVSVAESLAAGTPAIVSKGAPWGELNIHGAGWWIDSGIDPLVSCLQSALACAPSSLEEMGLRGRDWMEREHSWAYIGQQMVACYQWLLEGQDHGSRPGCVLLD